MFTTEKPPESLSFLRYRLARSPYPLHGICEHRIRTYIMNIRRLRVPFPHAAPPIVTQQPAGTGEPEVIQPFPPLFAPPSANAASPSNCTVINRYDQCGGLNLCPLCPTPNGPGTASVCDPPEQYKACSKPPLGFLYVLAYPML